MSTLSDVEALYGNLQGTWAKSRGHIIAHGALALVVFVLCGATSPEVALPELDVKQVTESDWFKLAKDTGLIYVSFVVPVAVVASYAAVLRTVGQVLVAILMSFFPAGSSGDHLRRLNGWVLEPLALSLRTEDFQLGHLLGKSAEFRLKYMSKKNEAWESYQRGLSDLANNAQVYLGDFLIFLAAWLVLFLVVPQTAWTEENQARFWRVAVVLMGLIWFAWFRVSRAVATMPGLELMFVSTMMRGDPDLAPLLDAPEEVRRNIRKKLEELLREERERVKNQGPSLVRFLCRQMGVSGTVANDRDSKKTIRLPFRSLYERGRRFAWEGGREQLDADEWLAGYAAYLYYRFEMRCSRFARSLWQVVRYLITGTP